MRKQLASRVSTLSPSTTLAITAKAKEMKAAGIDVIGLGAGEPDYNTPQNILEAAYQSMKDGKTKYTPAGGLPQLKDAIIDKLKRDQGLTYTRKEVLVGIGAKHVLYTLFQVLLNKGDEVIIPSPFWVSYPEQVKLAEGTPVFVEGTAAEQFKVSAKQIRDAITDQTKAIIINSPGNPTGMIYSKEELTAIAEVCREKDVWIISDEIYEKLVYDDKEHVSIAQLSEDAKDRTFIINGVSKSHSMTGWRIGYIAGNEEVVSAMTNLASHSTSNPTTTSQYAAIEAYNGPQDTVEVMRKDFESRLNQAYPKLSAIPGFHVLKPQGAFYLLPDVQEAVKKTGYANVDDFAQALLTEAKVAVIPGIGFGSDTTIRLSYATSIDLLEEGITRIDKFVRDHWKA
ncbi:aspartate aminotransferase [Sporosarcina sp. P21c]|uniref:pyridoxal phosphate-dependent aminotransferase n=1 Tax=unclassified Sporosarcina TaxID=2647733 RepID=UPI000C171132|nr:MULTISPECIES: pyridoxal phosphate-dependent aminotransferase [unclassified Sporosarcina]PIC68583.1 aspartate aminotransferase [Sporosarcina sp. P16a]PIC91231.1 aspartate aminotransferase [Sporosarcina sp. P21c]PIC93636.1 aspartate aminotransferase [Sporosarcina sp. P25]